MDGRTFCPAVPTAAADPHQVQGRGVRLLGCAFVPAAWLSAEGQDPMTDGFPQFTCRRSRGGTAKEEAL